MHVNFFYKSITFDGRLYSLLSAGLVDGLAMLVGVILNFDSHSITFNILPCTRMVRR